MLNLISNRVLTSLHIYQNLPRSLLKSLSLAQLGPKYTKERKNRGSMFFEIENCFILNKENKKNKGID